MPVKQINTTQSAICAVIDMTCAVYDGNVEEVKSLLKIGFPIEEIYHAGLATMSLAEFAEKFGTPEIKELIKSYRDNHVHENTSKLAALHGAWWKSAPQINTPEPAQQTAAVIPLAAYRRT